MAFPAKLLAVLLACFLASSLMISARKLDSTSTLVARLKLDEQAGSSSCWDALFELQSCSGEVVLFFLNGETHLGTNCCRAITTIERQCWPSVLGSLGITAQESNILRGYCDATAAGGSDSPPPTSLPQCSNLPRLDAP